MTRVMTKELREHALRTLAKIRERLPSLGEGQLTLSAAEGGDLAVATDAGTLAVAKDGA